MIGNEKTGQFFCVVESFWAGGIHCFAVNMVMAEEVLMQLSEFEDFGLRDYLIYCSGEVLYSSQNESAIDPHYIYNTLNTVTALAELGRCQEVVEVNNALIGTLKDRLKMKNYKTFDTVQAERETLEQYMVIQRYLCWAKIQFSFQVSEEDQNLLIPKNIIQPLVENAIKHGILCRDDDEIKEGKIDVTVEGCGEQIRITVQDNGAGMEEETVQRFFSREPGPVPEGDVSHIGVNNVRMRLKYLYRGNYEMTVDSRKNEGTVIRIVLPIRSEISGAYLF